VVPFNEYFHGETGGHPPATSLAVRGEFDRDP
jgi:hypothetical protein